MHRTKEEIRRRIHRERLALAPSEVEDRSRAVGERLMATDLYRQTCCLGCYVSVKNEVDTHRLIRAALREKKRVGAPKTDRGGGMVHLEIEALSDLRPGPFGLLEPSGANRAEILPADFDLILVPGIAFDRQGNRIGFGGGYYDRFLGLTPAPRVGLAYDFQLLERLPVDAQDVRLDFLATESEVYTFG